MNHKRNILDGLIQTYEKLTQTIKVQKALAQLRRERAALEKRNQC